MDAEELKNQDGAAQESAAPQESANAGAQEGANAPAEKGGSADAAAEEAQKPRSRELLVERVRGTLPEGEEWAGDNDDDLFDRLEGLIGGLADKSAKHDAFSKQIMDRYENDPEGMMALMDYLEGNSSYPAALRKYKGDEALSMKEGDEGWEEYEKAGKERADQLKKNLEKAKELKANAEASAEAYNKFAAAQGWDEEQSKKFWDYLYSDAEKFINGKYDDALFDRYKRSYDYDNDVAGAREAGRAEGENKQIEAKRKAMQGSGLPNGAGANGSAGEEVNETKKKSKEEITADWLASFRHR